MILTSTTPTKYTVYRRDNVVKVCGNSWFFGEENIIIAHTNWWAVAFILALFYRAKVVSGYMTKTVPTEEEIESAKAFQELLRSVIKP